MKVRTGRPCGSVILASTKKKDKMKITVGQTKRGVIIVFEDPIDDTSRTIHLLWREATGLYHGLKEAMENPAFEHRDPRSKNPEVRNLKTVNE